jgi:hypothetical protein
MSPRRLLLVIAVVLALSMGGDAQRYQPSHGVFPPPEYDHPFRGKVDLAALDALAIIFV